MIISGAKAIIESLKREGVDHIFSLPGTTILDLFDALHGDKEIKLIVSRHEQGAAFMADGYTRASGKPSVCMASRGPGAMNMAIAVHNAYMESSPVISLIGQVSQQFSQRDAFEEMDLVSVFRPFTKWSVEIQNGSRIPELVQRSVITSLIGRPRPVMISVPTDVQKAQVEPIFRPRVNIPKPRANITDIVDALSWILKANRPTIWAGGGVNSSGAHEELKAFSEYMNIPVITTWLRNDIFPNDHHLYLGAAGFGAPKSVFDFLLSSDLILAIGCRFSEFSTRTYTIPDPNSAVVNIDIEPEGLGRVLSPAFSIISDAKLALEDLLNTAKTHLNKADLDSMKEKWSKGVKEAREALLKGSLVVDGEYRGKFIHPGILIKEIQKTLDDDALIVTDSGSFMAWVGRFYQFKRPRSFISPAGGAMGFGFPAAIGAQLAQPNRRVVAITGDGGFMMVLQELETAVRYKIPVTVVVMNNFCFGNVKEKQLKSYGARITGSEYSNPDFAQLAKLFGAYGERVEKTSDIAPAMKRALGAGLPSVIDVIVDPELTLPPV